MQNGAQLLGASSWSNDPGGEFLFQVPATLDGSLNLGGVLRLDQSSVTVSITGSLNLAQSGTVDNRGTMRVGAFNDRDGTLLGNAPIVLGIAPAGGRFFRIVRTFGANPVR